DEKLLAEIEEGRPLIEENTLQPNTRSTQSEARVSQGLAGVRKAARENKEGVRPHIEVPAKRGGLNRRFR
ncbi:MAG: hypothetical protein WA869_07600, partial [Alloacidobacterium sp.]